MANSKLCPLQTFLVPPELSSSTGAHLDKGGYEYEVREPNKFKMQKNKIQRRDQVLRYGPRAECVY